MTTPEQLVQLLKQGIAQVRAGKFTEGYSALQQVIKQSPQNAEAWMWLGYMAAMQEDGRTAERCFLRAQRFGHPKAQQALQALAKTHETTNGVPATIEYQPTRAMAIPERAWGDNASATTIYPICSNCGYRNPPNHKFCGSCGQALPQATATAAPSSISGEVKPVSQQMDSAQIGTSHAAESYTIEKPLLGSQSRKDILSYGQLSRKDNFNINTGSLLIASGIAGLVMALLSNLPVLSYGNCLACMWLWASGILGAWLYRHFEGSTSSLTGGQGAVIGALSGLVGAVIGTIVSTFVGGAGLASLLASPSSNANEVFGTTAGSFAAAGAFSLIGLLFNAFLYPFFGAIGGAAGGVLFGKKATA